MKNILILSTIIFLTACTEQIKSESNPILYQQLISDQYHKPFKELDQTPIFVESITKETAELNKNIKIATTNITLAEAITLANDNFTIMADKGVNMSTKIPVLKFDNSLENYLKLLEQITGYAFTLQDDNIIAINATISKTWNIATLAESVQSNLSSASGSISKSGADSTFTDDESESTANNTDDNSWDNLLSNIENFNDSRALDISILENKKIGAITGFGSPKSIQNMNTYLEELLLLTSKQIYIQAQILDVTVDESTGRGINWNLISDASSKVQIGNQSELSIDGAGIFSIGSVGGATIDLGKNITLDLLLNLLNKQGRVRVLNQPNITVTNGTSAYITTGDEFSYVSSIDAVSDSNGNITTTSNLERVNVGVDMKVTARILDQDRIVVNILPIITSLKSFSSFTSGETNFQTPNIALQKLATQIIVKSGETIPLGGLIAEKISGASKGLGDEHMLGFLFNGVQKAIERREIVMLITPTIVGI